MGINKQESRNSDFGTSQLLSFSAADATSCPKCGQPVFATSSICKHCHQVISFGKGEEPNSSFNISTFLLVGSFALLTLSSMGFVSFGGIAAKLNGNSDEAQIYARDLQDGRDQNTTEINGIDIDELADAIVQESSDKNEEEPKTVPTVFDPLTDIPGFILHGEYVVNYYERDNGHTEQEIRDLDGTLRYQSKLGKSSTRQDRFGYNHRGKLVAKQVYLSENEYERTVTDKWGHAETVRGSHLSEKFRACHRKCSHTLSSRGISVAQCAEWCRQNEPQVLRLLSGR